MQVKYESSQASTIPKKITQYYFLGQYLTILGGSTSNILYLPDVKSHQQLKDYSLTLWSIFESILSVRQI